MRAILDEEASALEEKALTQAGVEIISGHTVGKISSYSPGEVSGVNLDDSRPIPCEMVLIASGFQPRIELVIGNRIKVNHGIVVDRHMATSMPDVYACGDVAEAYDFVHGENRLTPIWPNAYSEGRIAGWNMAGRPTEYQGGTTMNSLKYFGLNIVSAGMVTPPGSYEVITKKNELLYKKVILKDGLIMGLVFAGDIEKSGIIYNLMKDRVNVNSFKQALVADDFGLVYLPEEIWRAKVALSPSVLTSSPMSAQQPEEMLVGK